MCAIFGFVSNKANIQLSILDKMSKSIKYRGPDNYSNIVLNDIFYLGHNRLSILDLSNEANQPFIIKNYDYALVYNGEVYNYLEIRQELEALNYKFTTSSDTEVVYFALIEWGKKAIDKFNGMFAIAFINLKTNELLLIRDRLGVKPLYYTVTDNQLVFSSEIISLIQFPDIKLEINETALAQTLIFNTPLTSDSIFKNIYQLERGHILSYINNTISIEKYWTIPKYNPDYTKTEKEYLDEVENLLKDSIKLRLRSDVPIGLYLSGGIDSSLIASLVKNIYPNLKAFTAKYDNIQHDESIFAVEIAKHLDIDIEPVNVDIDDFQNFNPLVGNTPLTSSTFIPYGKIVEFSKKYIKVSLSGEGADEFFYGYEFFNKYKYFNNKISLFLLRMSNRFNFFFSKKNKELSDIFGNIYSVKDLDISLKGGIDIDEFKALFKNNVNLIQKLNNYYFDDTKLTSFPSYNELVSNGSYLTDVILKQGDHVTMHYSIEGRSPFLDYRLVELAKTIPYSISYKDNNTKYLLKSILEKYVPKKLWDRPKKGFSSPNKEWLENSINTDDIYNTFKKFDFIDNSILRNILDKYTNNKIQYKSLVWRMYYFHIWYIEIQKMVGERLK